MGSLWSPSLPWTHLILRGVVVYAAVLALLRISGKRQVGQMGAGEFVAILLLSNAVQNSMTGGDNSITGGLVLASVIVFMSLGVEWLTFRSKRLEAVLQGRPALLVHAGQPLAANLERELINLHELKTMLRKQGFHRFDEVQDAVLESDGSLSVSRKDEPAAPHI